MVSLNVCVDPTICALQSPNRMRKTERASYRIKHRGPNVSEQMRGTDTQPSGMSSYLSPEERHPLRAMRRMTDEALQGLSAKFNELYSASGRPPIASEKLLRV